MTTEEQFRAHEKNRKDLRAILNSGVFQKAIEVLVENRKTIEYGLEMVALGSTELVSVRLHSQRIGMENLLRGLQELTEPMPITEQEQPAAFGAEEALAKLQKLGISI